VALTTLFFDIGGVLLTNGWDRHCWRRVVESFGLDYDEFRARHEFIAHDFETGRLDLAEYLFRTVFYRPRSFTEDEFIEAMKRQSQPLPGSLELLDDLAACVVHLATLNNARELNEHRIDTFGLRHHFKTFLSSCYVGYKKPEPQIYRLAFAVTQATRRGALHRRPSAQPGMRPR
jgi:putative hydrolase of the HAD superfamily